MQDSVSIIGIERVVLSSFLFDYEALEESMQRLKPEFFYLPAHQIIYKTMEELLKGGFPIDEEFIRRKVSNKEVDDSILMDILASNPITNIDAYCGEIIESYKKRQFSSLATLIKKSAIEENLSSDECIALLQNGITEIENLEIGSSDVRTLGECAADFENEPELEKIATGIQWLDSPKCLDGGFRLSNFVFLSGEKESGKTYLATTILENMAISGHKVGFFPLEFGTKAYYETLMKEKYPSAHKDNAKLKALKENIYIEDGVTDILDIEKKVIKMHKKGCKFVFVDSKLRLTHRTFTKGTLTNMLSDVFQRLGILTMKLQMVIMIVVQMPKEAYESGKLSVKDCVDADHEASIWINIKRNDDETRDISMGKNKQNYKRLGITCKFDPITHSFKKIKDNIDEHGNKINNSGSNKGRYVGNSNGIPVYDEREQPIETSFESEQQVHSTDEYLSTLNPEGIDSIL